MNTTACTLKYLITCCLLLITHSLTLEGEFGGVGLSHDAMEGELGGGVITSVADQGFPRGGGTNPKGMGAPTYYLANFS